MKGLSSGKAGAEELEGRYPTWPTLRRLLSEAARVHLASYVVAFFLMLGTAGAVAATAWIIRDVINEIFIAQQREMVLPIALAILGVFALKGITGYGSTVILASVSASILATLKKRMIAKVLQQEMQFFDHRTTGEITARFNQNAAAARQVITVIMGTAIRDVLTLIALSAVMIYQDPVLSLVALLIIPPALFGLGWVIRKVRSIAHLEFHANANNLKILTDIMRGMHVIKSFNLERNRLSDMEASITDVEVRARQAARYNAITLPLADTLGGLGIAIVILYGGYAIIDQNGDAGTLFSFIAAFLMAYEPATKLGRLNVQIQRSMVGVRFMYELLDEPLSLEEVPNAKALPPGPGNISFKNVTFAYDKAPALRDFSLDIRAGEFLAIVGPSGSGKSTLFNMLMRFYDPDVGSIEIDGHDISTLTLESLRNRMATVGQTPFLFLGSIRDNIMIARPEANEFELQRAIETAYVNEFLDRLPDGIETEVGEGGARLSGGQRQRVAIARTMLKDAPIVLFDEATSALDSESEAQVQSAFEELRQGRTALVIAHRLSTLRNADRVAVLQDGRLVELGTHEELLQKPGVFSALHEVQQTGMRTL